MKKTFTFLMLAFLLVGLTNIQAQIPTTSPFPVDFELTAPAASARSISYGTMADFGANLTQTVVGEVAWAYGAVDSLVCDTVVQNDVTDKIAMIRRGACNFSLKIWNAQAAGAKGVIIVNHYDDDTQGAGDVINMAGGDSAALVVVPSVFISRETGELLDGLIQDGETVEVSFTVSFSLNPTGPSAYGTPISQAADLEFIQFEVFNPSAENVVLTPSATAVITDPSGGETTLTSSLDSISAETSGLFEFDTYSPSEVGEYTITFTNSLNEDVLTRAFAITDGVFQADNGEIVPNINGTIEPSEETFLADELVYHAGNYYTTGPNPGSISHISFMISNPDELLTGDSDADQFEVVLYDTDADDDGVIDIAMTSTTLDVLTPVASSIYTLSASDQPFDLLTVQLDEPVQLKPTHQYVAMVQYNGANAAIGIPPKYAFAGNDAYVFQLAEGMFLGGDITHSAQLNPTGFAGSDYNFVVRMYEAGTVNTKDFSKLEASKIEVSPNPATEYTQLTFDLSEVADVVEVRLLDVSGRVLNMTTYENVQNNTFDINVKGLSAGTYFLSVITPEGYRTEKLVIGK